MAEIEELAEFAIATESGFEGRKRAVDDLATLAHTLEKERDHAERLLRLTRAAATLVLDSEPGDHEPLRLLREALMAAEEGDGEPA